MSDYITKSTVKGDYGLTDSMIKELGEPDKIKPNPHYRSAGAPMQLYLRERVEKWVAENRDRIEKVLKRRKPKAEKVEELPFVPLKRNPGSDAPYRQSQRQIGDKWSWSVYDNAEHQVLKTGWAFSEEEAKKICADVIQLAAMGFLDSYG